MVTGGKVPAGMRGTHRCTPLAWRGKDWVDQKLHLAGVVHPGSGTGSAGGRWGGPLWVAQWRSTYASCGSHFSRLKAVRGGPSSLWDYAAFRLGSQSHGVSVILWPRGVMGQQSHQIDNISVGGSWNLVKAASTNFILRQKRKMKGSKCNS